MKIRNDLASFHKSTKVYGIPTNSVIIPLQYTKDQLCKKSKQFIDTIF